jgi:hypothetical protein
VMTLGAVRDYRGLGRLASKYHTAGRKTLSVARNPIRRQPHVTGQLEWRRAGDAPLATMPALRTRMLARKGEGRGNAGSSPAHSTESRDEPVGPGGSVGELTANR